MTNVQREQERYFPFYKSEAFGKCLPKTCENFLLCFTILEGYFILVNIVSDLKL